MLGVGPMEIFVMAVVALVIFGPGKLPEVAGQVGRAVRDFRRMTADLTGEFERTIAEVDDVKETVRKEVKGMRAEVEGVSKSVKKDLESISETTGDAKTGTAAKKPATGKGAGGRAVARPAANGAAVAEPLPIASKADPLADVSLLDDEPTVASSSGPLPVDGAGKPAASNGKASTSEAAKTERPEAAPSVAAAGADDDGAEANRPELAVVGGGEPDEALLRARRRRAEAGYRRRA